MNAKDIDQENLDTAIAVGDKICETLGICCAKRGQVIYDVYQKLEDLKVKKAAPVSQQTGDTEADKGTSLSGSTDRVI
jgi:hypothetical protein